MELKLELRGAVKTALYRIAVAYGDHLKEVQGRNSIALKMVRKWPQK